MKSDKVELVYQYRGRLYIFQNVPAGVCEQCGEKYLTAKVAKEIERKRQLFYLCGALPYHPENPVRV